MFTLVGPDGKILISNNLLHVYEVYRVYTVIIKMESNDIIAVSCVIIYLAVYIVVTKASLKFKINKFIHKMTLK